jgi:Tol biopolymer transport system component
MRNRAEGIFAFTLIAAAAPAWAAGTTTLVSVSSGGARGDGESAFPAVSADGRFVAFVSAADNLVVGDTNRAKDVFVRDRSLSRTERVSVSSGGAQADGDSGLFGGSTSIPVAISADGRFVAFVSRATNLVLGDTNFAPDVFVRDRKLATTIRVSVAPSGVQALGQSPSVSISADGRFVAFQSDAANLVAGDTNRTYDVFVRDRTNRTTQYVSRSFGGRQGDGASIAPAISADGQHVVFASAATNLVPGDTNGQYDVFVRDRVASQTKRVSVATGGTQGDRASGLEGAAISADGQIAAVASDARNLVPRDTNLTTDVFVRDRTAGTTARVSLANSGAEANGFSFLPAISADGRLVAFGSWADNLTGNPANGVPDVFVRDRRTGVTALVSVAVSGGSANRHSGQNGVAISADGRFVAFQSYASNLVLGDTNNVGDVFVRER